MPRPKRTKVAPSVPAPRVKNTSKPAIPAPTVNPAPTTEFNDLYDVSDQEDRAVRSAPHLKKSNGKGKESVTAQRLEKNPTNGPNDHEDEEMPADDPGVGGDTSLLSEINLESSSPGMEVGRKEHNIPAVESSLLAIGNFRRRARQPSILGNGPTRGRSSSLDSNIAEGNGFMSVGRKNASALGSNFKRRPRENSIMGRKGIPSSMGLEMDIGTPANAGPAMKLGTFKRRVRQPSILGTAQKVQRELEYDDDEDDFNPEDESTPLNLSKARNMTSSSAASSSNPRKRKLSAVQVPQSSPVVSPPKTISVEETIPATGPTDGEDEGEEEDNEELPAASPEPVLPSVESRSISPEILSETMAPPISSSPTPSSPELPPRSRREPSRGRRLPRGRTPPPRTQDSPISSPPSLTHSPNYRVSAPPKTKPTREAPPPSTFSTAQLQALLPRRRRRAVRDTFDIPSSDEEVDVSGLAPDEDELSHLAVRARTRRPANALSRPSTATKKVSKLKAPDKGKQKRTYGRANPTSDKENDGGMDPDDSLAPLPEDGHESPENSQDLEQRVGKELKRAARKFAEVDQWELEFEEVTASSSSPKDAR